MTRDEFIKEYTIISLKIIALSFLARSQGLLALEEELDQKKINKRDILQLGMRFVVDGTDAEIIKGILDNIISQERDEYAKRLKEIMKEGILSIQAGDNPRILVLKLNSLTDLDLDKDKAVNYFNGIKCVFSKDEINALLKDVDDKEPELEV
jgi:flagellar motor component MotA